MAHKYLVALVFLILYKAGSCERLHEQIYSSIEGGAACYRLLNGSHQVGCTSSDKGTVGVVHMINNVSDAQWLAYNATAGPYMAVVNTALFHNIIELLIGYSENVAGVLLYDSASKVPTAFSQESRCPNEYSSDQGSQCSSTTKGGIVWNEPGTGLLKRNIPFPMFYLPQSRAEEIVKIQQCYERFNLDRNNHKGMPLCSLQLYSFMYAAVNSIVCLRRSASSALLTPTKVCDPLGDQNVYYSLFPRSKEATTTKKPVTLITGRIDTASLFDSVAPGAASTVVGMVTLVTAATVLAKMIPLTDSKLYNHNILWTLFNGEAFDYIGSQRVAYDISRGVWPPDAPLSPSDINLHVEIGQLGGALLKHSGDTSWPLNAFIPNKVHTTQIEQFLQEMTYSVNQYNISMGTKNNDNLPPSSLHSFRRILKNQTESGELSEILIVDHDDTFSNLFYNSAVDDYKKIGFVYHNISIGSNGTFISTEELLRNGTMKETEVQVKIANLAQSFARALYDRVTGQRYTGNISASAHLVDEMLYCYLKSQACRLFLAADFGHSNNNEESLPTQPVPLYVGVSSWPTPPALFTGNLLAILTGTHLAANRSTCDALTNPDFTYYWLRGWNHSGVCIQTTMNFSNAVSPAFIVPDYDFTSGMYSTWTESVWQTLWARVFVSAGGGGARAAAVAGVLVTAVAGFLTYWLRRHARIVFCDASLGNDAAATGILRTVNC